MHIRPRFGPWYVTFLGAVLTAGTMAAAAPAPLVLAADTARVAVPAS